MNKLNTVLMGGLAVALFSLYPDLDLWLHAWLWDADEGFYLRMNPVVLFFYHGVEVFTAVAVLISLAILIVGSRPGSQYWSQKRRGAAFFLLAVILGPGLIVNATFKENWGRARPAHVQEFGGDKHYTPPLQIADQCQRNCSFVSGHASMGFVIMALGCVFPRRRREWAAVGLAVGCIVGAGRMMQGRHFFSDIVFCGVLVTASILWLDAVFTRLYEPLPKREPLFKRPWLAPWLVLRRNLAPSTRPLAQRG